ncbi:hypothetical protein OHA84_28305 [Streptomyces sp. NBC_00513]|uniref:hypothetical protein n=1 Tax=unclassified Streptomyces TaxID=2593676 RepID=UPI0022581A9E|nr:hypothetical protein [Streptomyces sp. NBC_00424]MCX5072584.1 hypothetical protein [Streptomyces sp. NBC_00424]WUD44096.1 hypothetical protein OHA84_28305 [Streptomyces sp. NBC_00513]
MSARFPADGTEPSEGIHVEARVQGQGQAYQVVQGTQKIVHHHHYSGSNPAPPLGLPELRLWIKRLASDYRTLIADGSVKPGRRQAAAHHRQLDALYGELAGAAGNRDGKEQLRRLLAAGAVQYLDRATPVPDGALPEAVMVDLVVFALWPVVQTPRLPGGWQDHLAELTTPRLAAFVAGARDAAGRGRPISPEAFGRALAGKPFAPGILALLDDLDDPRGGGASLTALSLAGRYAQPPQKAGAKALLGWLLGAGAVGAVGGAGAASAVDFADRAWQWLHDTGRGSTHHGSGGPDMGDDEDLDQHRGGGRVTHGAGPAHGAGPSHGPGHDAVGDFIDDLFS